MQLTGDLSKVSLANLLQLVRNGELTGKISLLQGVKTATIFLDLGQVIHVELDGANGREALMELFLWGRGTFSFLEENVTEVPRSLIPSRHQEHTMERLVRDGIGYLEQKKYLDQMQISGQTVLIPTDMALQPQTWLPPGRSVIYRIVEPILTRIDGRRTLAEALADANLTRRSFVAGVYNLLAGGFALVREPEPDFDEHGERVNLPPWVVARLKQDNPDLSQAIVDLVIWVDRVKCWMYQVDADFSRIIEAVNLEEEIESTEEDFFAQLEQGEFDSEEPFFGESLIPSLNDSGESSSAHNSPDSPSTDRYNMVGSQPALAPPVETSSAAASVMPQSAVKNFVDSGELRAAARKQARQNQTAGAVTISPIIKPIRQDSEINAEESKPVDENAAQQQPASGNFNKSKNPSKPSVEF